LLAFKNVSFFLDQPYDTACKKRTPEYSLRYVKIIFGLKNDTNSERRNTA